MTAEFLDPGGTPVAPEALATAKARQLAGALERCINPFARLLECRQEDAVEIVVVEVDVEVPQDRQHDIRSTERLAVRFDHEDRSAPEILALRADFPVVPHLNLRPQEVPRSLCLFEEPYRELKSRWTAPMLIERIREWLRLTARGELHAEDQPLEPLLLPSAGTLLISHRLVASIPEGEQQPIVATRLPVENRLVLIVNGPPAAAQGREVPPFVLTPFTIPPQLHGVIRRTPQTLFDLQSLLAELHFDLIGFLRERLRTWNHNEKVLGAQLILLVDVPKTRSTGTGVEAVDRWAFLTEKPVRDIGCGIGCWDMKAGHIGALLPFDETKRGENINLLVLNVVQTLSREQAAWMNGHEDPSDVPIAAIGCGALGSQVLFNSLRGAFGRWTVIDEDLLLPHNLSRHACDGRGIGWPKADAAAVTAAGIIDDAVPAVVPITADILEPGKQAEQIQGALSRASAILDMSASLTVPRHLARAPALAARRISMFLNPAGTDLTVLAEDTTRSTPLDVLEMQYYQALVTDAALRGHLEPPAGRLRYGHSCRDVTRRLSQDLVALHAAIAARALRSALDAPGPTARVWRADATTLEVRMITLETAPARERRCGEWTVITDLGLERRLADLRLKRLPNETGGVLLGRCDLDRQLLFVTHALPSPVDSAEEPEGFVRGYEGLRLQLREAAQVTSNQLHYVGEWHSHPDGHSTRPSVADLKLLGWLTGHMAMDGLPGVMIIVGENAELATYVGQSSG